MSVIFEALQNPHDWKNSWHPRWRTTHCMRYFILQELNINFLGPNQEQSGDTILGYAAGTERAGFPLTYISNRICRLAETSVRVDEKAVHPGGAARRVTPLPGWLEYMYVNRSSPIDNCRYILFNYNDHLSACYSKIWICIRGKMPMFGFFCFC